LIAVIAVIALAAGCSADHRPDALAPDLPPLPGPGTELLDGYVVPEGAERLGGVYPFAELVYAGHLPESSWSVSFVVDGDPRVPADDVLDQARAAGLETRSNCEVTSERVMCQVLARRLVNGYLEDELTFRADRGPESASGGMFYQRFGPGIRPANGPGVWDDPQDEHWAPVTPMSFPPVEAEPGHFPESGEPFTDEPDVEPGIVVPDGAIVATPVADDCCGAYSALLYIPGDIEPVVADIEEQFGRWQYFETSTERQTIQGIDTVQVLAASGEGGGQLTFQLVVDDSGSWARIQRSPDP
jgi:hypothetical protein